VDESVVIINPDFYDARKAPADILAEVQLFDRNIIALPDIRQSVRKAGIIAMERSDEDIDNDVDLRSPLE